MKHGISLVIVMLCSCSKPEPRQVTVEQFMADERYWPESQLKDVKKEALNGNKRASIGLSSYYFMIHPESGSDFASLNWVYWAKNSLKYKDCLALNHLNKIYSDGLISDKYVESQNSEVKYLVKPDPSYVKFLKAKHKEWRCPNSIDGG